MAKTLSLCGITSAKRINLLVLSDSENLYSSPNLSMPLKTTSCHTNLCFVLKAIFPPLWRHKLPIQPRASYQSVICKITKKKKQKERGNFSSSQLLLTPQAILQSLNQLLELYLSAAITPHLEHQPALTWQSPVLPNSHQLCSTLLLLLRSISLRGCFPSSNSLSLFLVPDTDKLPLP